MKFTTKTEGLLLLQFAVTAAMTGIIWLVQFVTYPQFLDVNAADFPAYHRHHTHAIGLVVAPLMIFELGLAAHSAWHFRHSRFRVAMILGAALVAALWLVTFLVQVPLHETLSAGRSERSIEQLVGSNWNRTALWTIRLGLLFGVVLSFRPKLPAPG